MRTRAYRRHQKERFKNKAIRRYRDGSRGWRNDIKQYDWETILNHYGETREGSYRYNHRYFVMTDEAWTAKFIVKYQNGHKFHDNPPKWFKQHMNRKRRAIVQDRMVHEDYENIPRFPTENCWIWD